MRNARPIFASLMVGLICGGAAVAVAEEHGAEHDKAVAEKDLPAAVLATARVYAEGGALLKAVRADEDGVLVYQLVYRVGARTLEVQTTESGQLFATEERVDERAVPEAVRLRAAKIFAAGDKVSYERVQTVIYEAAGRPAGGKGETEVLINLAGAAFREVAGGIYEEKK